ncbi:DUF488 domain-containing protein [Candidatus Bipolaricaulota bacterium]|nr:DUF488 domain-containing protein [Candidatus Bipolaricaulota bacterium]
MINTGYLAKIKSYPKQEEHILVMRNRGNNELAPSGKLLSKWKNEEISWSEYREIFTGEMKSQESQERLTQIAEKVAENKDIRLICYEGEGEHCHRHILKSLVEEKLETF